MYHDENVRVSAILVPHYDVFPSFAFRFDTATGKSVTFSGDTVKSDNVVRLARGTDLLVHECIFTLNSVYHQRSHTSAEQVGEVAAAAAAGRWWSATTTRPASTTGCGSTRSARPTAGPPRSRATGSGSPCEAPQSSRPS